MPTKVTVVVRGVPQALAKIEKIINSTQHPQGGLIRATNNVADVFRKNFDEEGSMIPGGWPELAEATQDIRENEGFDRDHPILFRYGALRGVAIEFFQKATHSGQTSRGDNYSKQITSASLSIKDKVAILEAQGWKVANQWGHPNRPPYGRVPARPFWFINENSIAAARDGVRDWLLDEVIK